LNRNDELLEHPLQLFVVQKRREAGPQVLVRDE
jgi:hypothetical protein